MPPTIPQPAALAETARTLHEICEAAARCNCGACWAHPHEPCATVPPGGTHLARIARAVRRGLLDAADMSPALAGLDVFSGATVIRDGAR